MMTRLPSSWRFSKRWFRAATIAVRLQKPSGANVAAGLFPGVGANDLDISRGEQLHIFLCGGMAPHLLVHGRRDRNGSGGRQGNRRQQIVGPTLS